MNAPDLARDFVFCFPPEDARATAEPRNASLPYGSAHSALRGLIYGLVFEAAGAALALAAWRLI